MTDADRPLTRHGEAAAARMGAECAARGWRPALALVSTARRAEQTWARFAPALAAAGAAPLHRPCPALYLATPGAIARVLAEEGDGAASVLVIGHNPGLQDAVSEFTRRGPHVMREIITRGFPTCALARVELAAESWDDVFGVTAQVTAILKPKELAQR